MHLTGGRLILSASDLTGFLECAHLTQQELAATRGELVRPEREDPELELIARQSRGRLHIVLINPSSILPAVARIRLAKNYHMAIDRGIEGGFAVPLSEQGAGQAFDIQLAPGEGTMIELIPRRSTSAP